MPINDKQQEFILEYCSNGHNASKAYQSAYPDCKSGHRQSAQTLLTNPDIKEAIAGYMAELKQETGWSVGIALNKLKAIMDKSIAGKQYSSAVSAIVAANRMFALDQDAQVNPDHPALSTPQELAYYREVVDARRQTTGESPCKLAGEAREA